MTLFEIHTEVASTANPDGSVLWSEIGWDVVAQWLILTKGTEWDCTNCDVCSIMMVFEKWFKAETERITT